MDSYILEEYKWLKTPLYPTTATSRRWPRKANFTTGSLPITTPQKTGRAQWRHLDTLGSSLHSSRVREAPNIFRGCCTLARRKRARILRIALFGTKEYRNSTQKRKYKLTVPKQQLILMDLLRMGSPHFVASQPLRPHAIGGIFSTRLKQMGSNRWLKMIPRLLLDTEICSIKLYLHLWTQGCIRIVKHTGSMQTVVVARALLFENSQRSLGYGFIQRTWIKDGLTFTMDKKSYSLMILTFPTNILVTSLKCGQTLSLSSLK